MLTPKVTPPSLNEQAPDTKAGTDCRFPDSETRLKECNFAVYKLPSLPGNPPA